MNEILRDLIYDWNTAGEQPARAGGRKIEFDDETLRDGLQSPSVTDPSLDEKVRALHYMNDIGVDSADIGLPGAGPHVQRSVERLAREIVDAKLSVAANCAARTHENDIRPIAEISQRVGIPIEACTFIGSSPIRQFAEEWQLDWIIEQSTKAVRFAVKEGLPVMYVTEDTTRAKPEDVEKLYTAAIEAGAKRVCVCDTVGHVTPWGVHAAAIRKARTKGSQWLADPVYSGVPAGMFGLEQVIEVGPMSGLSNVIYWLASHRYPTEESLATEVFQLAKSTNRVLTDDELHSAARHWQETHSVARVAE